MDAGWRYLGRITRRLRWTVAGAIGAGLAWQGAAIAAPLLVRRAIDTGVVHGGRSTLWWAAPATTSRSRTARSPMRTFATRSSDARSSWMRGTTTASARAT